MIPIRSQVRVPTLPWAAYSLFALNLLVYLQQFGMDPATEEAFLASWGVTPYWLLHSHHLQTLLTPFTSMFVHGGFFHFASNMWFLLVFAGPVEYTLGRGRFLAYYIIGGLVAVAAQVAVAPASRIPMVGASGAIATVLGAYWVLYPRARILTLLPIFIFLQFIEIPAFVFIILWFLSQVLMGVAGLSMAGDGGVAFFAHIGGTLAGVFLQPALVQCSRTLGFRWRGRRGGRRCGCYLHGCRCGRWCHLYWCGCGSWCGCRRRYFNWRC